MVSDFPLLSIVIPTRNRTKYCIYAIKNILKFEESCFELIIHDNSNSLEIKEYCETVKDERLVYKYKEGRINSSLNMDIALGYAKGEYVIMIGDDDTVLNNIFDIVLDAKKKRYDCIISASELIYIWPKEYNDGVLEFRKKDPIRNFVNNDEKIRKLLKNGLLNYSEYNLPRVYHGIVKRKILSEIKSKTGGFINGLSPDIYLTISCAMLCENTYISEVPFTIAGVCPASSTAENIRGEHRGAFSDIPHLYGRENYKWDIHIPKVYSIETIWGDSALKALKDFGKLEYYSKFSQGYFGGGLIFRNRKISGLIIKEIFKTRIHGLFPVVIYDFFRFMFDRLRVKFVNSSSRETISYYESNVGDIEDAVNKAKKYY